MRAAHNEAPDTVPLAPADLDPDTDESQGFSDTLPLGWKHSENSTFFEASRTEHPPARVDTSMSKNRRSGLLAALAFAAVLATLIQWWATR